MRTTRTHTYNVREHTTPTHDIHTHTMSQNLGVKNAITITTKTKPKKQNATTKIKQTINKKQKHKLTTQPHPLSCHAHDTREHIQRAQLHNALAQYTHTMPQNLDIKNATTTTTTTTTKLILQQQQKTKQTINKKTTNTNSQHKHSAFMRTTQTNPYNAISLTTRMKFLNFLKRANQK